MATYYLDYEGGSDAADGTSFANRWKTITSGATAARIAPNDTIRIMGSPAPTSLGINATWTNKSTTVTLASALNVLIAECDSAWTASANVTATVNTNTLFFIGTMYRTGTGNAKLAIASGFTTGKVAYLDLGSNQDYSAYQGVTFWLQVETTTLAAGVLTLDLCSDTIGATPVDTLAIPAVSQVGQWIAVHIDKGSALGSAIRSISINAISDPGTINVHIDNLSTTKAVGNDCLTLQSLIGKNSGDELWWALRRINGTVLTLDLCPQMDPSLAGLRGYWGTSESVTTYKRETIKTTLVASDAAAQEIQDSGTAGNLITFSGGWNRTDMSSQTLDTYFDGQSGYGTGIASVSKSYLSLTKLWCVRYNYGLHLTGADNAQHGTLGGGHCRSNGIHWMACNTATATELTGWSCLLPGFAYSSNGADWTITRIRSLSNGSSLTASGMSFSGGNDFRLTTCDFHNNAVQGLTSNGSSLASHVLITTLNCQDNGDDGALIDGPCPYWRIVTASLLNNGGVGLKTTGPVHGQLRIGSLTATGNTEPGLELTTGFLDCEIGLLTTSGNGTASLTLQTISGHIKILSSSLAEATKINLLSSAYSNGYLRFHNFNGTVDDHRTYYGEGVGGGTIFSESSVRHTASGRAWALSPKTATHITANMPMALPLAKILCNASTLVTVKVWLRRTSTSLSGVLRCRGGQIAGVTSDVTDSIGAASDTWEEQTITFTPTVKGVVEIDVLCYGGTTHTLYVDDLTVSQG